MLKIFNFLKKENSDIVKEIHNEFDEAEQKILDECSAMLSELKIVTESQVQKKAKSLVNLGFTSSETIKQAKLIESRNDSNQKKIDFVKKQMNTIMELKQKYPFEKFITLDELNRICKKYNLMYASVKYYKKDVPEKNVNDLLKMKKLSNSDQAGGLTLIENLNDLAIIMLKHMGKKNNIFSLDEKIDLLKLAVDEDQWGRLHLYDSWLENNNWFRMGGSFYLKEHNLYGSIDRRAEPNYSKSKVIERNGYFIAAPKNHFDLSNISKETEFGFYEVRVTEIKDPVVFEFCKNEIVRICTKWGTPDDQSYLDPALVNEKMN